MIGVGLRGKNTIQNPNMEARLAVPDVRGRVDRTYRIYRIDGITFGWNRGDDSYPRASCES